MFWPTSTTQILIKFSFLESQFDIRKRIAQVLRKKLQIFCKQLVKVNLHIFSFSWLKIRFFKILQKFFHIWNSMVKGFSKMYNFSFFWQIFFCTHFYYITGFCDKKFNFCKFANFFADSKSRAQELSNDVSFVIFWHQTWDLEGVGGQIDPPQRILVFKYPSRDRVKDKKNRFFFIFTFKHSFFLC